GYSLQDGSADIIPGVAMFNAFTPSITSGIAFVVPVGARGTVPVSIDASEWANTPALGLMIVILDNSAGRGEARLLAAGSEGSAGRSDVEAVIPSPATIFSP